VSDRGIVIVSPALADANNGNWRTASRWRRLLGGDRPVRITSSWPDGHEARDGVMFALHARRSAAAIAAWAERRGSLGLAVVLTGTDLYRDIDSDARARHSLDLAGLLVVLNECAPDALPASLRHKAHVVLQSASVRRPVAKPASILRAVMVGHLRDEKDPATLLRAAALLRNDLSIRIDHIGAGLDPDLAAAARETMRCSPGYRWLGALDHEATRRRIQRAHVLVHASLMEGGAHVVIEAIRSGTPVIASRIDGNVGLLGADYEGYFPVGDETALVAALRRARPSSPGGWLARLREQCDRRAPRFSAEAESGALHAALQRLEAC
jgi:putative glycosyltransferase (TIGR04348 family)